MENEVLKQVTEAIEKSVPEIVSAVVDAKLNETMSKSAKELDEIKNELKKYSLEQKQAQPEVKEAFVKTAVVSIYKEIINNNVNTEKGFNDVVEATLKTMTEWTATAWAELVFDQFEADVLRVINSYDVLADVRILPLAKWDKVSIPKATNGITTYFTAEWVAYTPSDAVTAFVTIDIAKTTTLTDMTQELLDDTMTVPDLYNLIVEFIWESQAEFLETEILTWIGSVKWVLVQAWINSVALAATKKSADITDDDIVEVMVAAKRKFKRRRANVKWYMSQYIKGQLMKLKTLDGYPLYPELRGATPSLLGYAVVESDVWFVQDVSEDIANAITLAFWDLQYFILARRKGITMERGYHGDNWKKDIISLKSNGRVWGKTSFPEAITILKNGPAV